LREISVEGQYWWSFSTNNINKGGGSNV